ncbi:hypothetical protein [Lactobacillus acetotolerans]|uniref:hypothetical protein n=1 Tax=Lactobacillus acetotolerans TaxID=1600 RepID=UPI002FDB1F29
MIFNHVINFYIDDDEYNPDTGEYGGGSDNPVLTKMANVTDVGTDKTVQIFGNYKQKSKTIRFIQPINVKWDYLTIDESRVKYALQIDRKPLKNATLIVGETK